MKITLALLLIGLGAAISWAARTPLLLNNEVNFNVGAGGRFRVIAIENGVTTILADEDFPTGYSAAVYLHYNVKLSQP